MPRWFSAVVVALLVVALSEIANARPVLASTCYAQFDYAFQYTGTLSTSYSDPTCAGNGYYGWIGVNGQIQTPSHFPDLGGNTNSHSVGWLGITFNDPPGPLGSPSFVQEGWYAGCVGVRGYVGCTDSSTGLRAYDEHYFANIDLYRRFDVTNGSLAYNDAHIYRMEWDGNSCWVIYFNYNVYQDEMCDSLYPPARVPRSGLLEASSETYTANGNHVEMPTTIYGYANPNTNNALRVRGAAGYVSWTPNLSTGGTIGWDERNSNPTTYISAFNPSYKIEGCGSC